jgi:hypothetical protein
MKKNTKNNLKAKDYSMDDVELQRLLQKLEVPNLLCPSKKTITSVCTNKSCKAKNALHCGTENCPHCSHLHLNCSELKISKLTTLVERRMRDSRNFLLQLIEQEQRMIEKIRNNRNILIEGI